MPLLTAVDGLVSIVMATNTKGTLELPGQPKLSLSEAQRTSAPSPATQGTQVIALPSGARASLEFGDFTFRITQLCASSPVRHGIQRADLLILSYFIPTLAAIGCLLAVMSLFTPPSGVTEDEGIDADNLYLVQQYLDATAERERGTKPPELFMEKMENNEGGTGTRAKGEEGAAGAPVTKKRNLRYALTGDKAWADTHLARVASLREARDFGMIGLLNSEGLGDPNASTSPWGQSTSVGRDELSARGDLWGQEMGNAWGASGFGLSGIGEGGGGRGEGIGLGHIGTLGHGAGTGCGQGFGNGSGGLYGCGCGEGTSQSFGAGHGRIGGSHKASAPKVRLGHGKIEGHLPPEVIQRIVRQNFGRMQQCYEQGLMKSPHLQGRVSVRFVIGRDGSVSNVKNGESDLSDSDVISCVMRSYYGLSFPVPDGGIVTVVYPIQFAPG
jgi:hypothetical protein